MKDVPRITDAQWDDIEKTLPASAHRTSVRTRLEQIAQTKSSPRERATQCDEIARLCNELSRALLKKAGETDLTGLSFDDAELIEELGRRRDAAKKQAVVYRRIKRPRFLRQCEILWLWQKVGGDLGIATPRKRRDEVRSPSPNGPVIPYFRAVAKAIFGKTPTPRQIKDIVSDYRHLNFSAGELAGASKLVADAEIIKGTS